MSEDVTYKHFDEEESRIFKQSIETIRASVNDGLKFDAACGLITIDDEELKRLIVDDALKIEIAELHYGRGLSLLDVSKKLGVSVERLLKASEEMMEDILHTAEITAKKQPGGSEMEH